MDKFANNIKWLRKTHHLTQPDFGALFGKTYGGVSNWERGERVPPADDLTSIADYFGITVNDLLFTDLSNVQDDREEKEMLQLFRKATPEQQRTIIQIIRNIVEGFIK